MCGTGNFGVVEKSNDIASRGQGLLFQLIFWCGLLLVVVAKDYAEAEQAKFTDILGYDLCHILFEAIAANFFYFVLVRRFLLQRKYVLFGLLFLVCLYLLSVLNRIFVVYVAEPFFIDLPRDSIMSILTDMKYLFFYYAFSILSGAFVFISVMVMLNYKNERQQAIRLQKEKAELELKSLRTQLNPHFLFNTLNNIYSLSLTGSEKTPEMLAKLADMLDYILYKSQQPFVSLADELRIVHDYVALAKLRFDERLTVYITEEGGSANLVPPLLYLSLVENAFKHGAGKIKGPVVIRICIKAEEAGITFQVENTCIPEEETGRDGIGLKNIREQLKLAYNDKATLKVWLEQHTFTVKLVTP